jgi:hypothetical protein
LHETAQFTSGKSQLDHMKRMDMACLDEVEGRKEGRKGSNRQTARADNEFQNHGNQSVNQRKGTSCTALRSGLLQVEWLQSMARQAAVETCG